MANKYPYIIFYRHDAHSEVDNYFIQNNNSLECTIFFTNNENNILKMFDSNYHLLITCGDDEKEYAEVNSIIVNRFRDRWIHFNKNTLLTISILEFNNAVNYCYIHNCSFDREKIRPIFSVFTPTYNSYHKIERAYKSLKSQTLKDWEFVIIDDSPDDNHFIFLKNLMGSDPRVRLFKKSENNGSIGNLKNEAVSLCRGKYVLEFDHDDEILPNVLKDATECFDNNEDVGFIYMDCSIIYENGNNFHYGDFICKGYGSYYCTKYNNKWMYVYNTPNINNITLSHLVCCPNHPRIWRKSVLLQAGNYCEMLPICDDYEIILRTALITNIAKIHKLGYIQYMNNDSNNFSLIRNKEINRIGPTFISPIYYSIHKIQDAMKIKGAYEDEKYNINQSKIWEREDAYEHKYCNKVINNDYDKQYYVIGIDSLFLNIDKIKELYNSERNDFYLIDNKCDIKLLQHLLDIYGFSKFKCYTLIDNDVETLKKYVLFTYKHSNNYEIIDSNYIERVKYNTNYSERHDVINSVSSPNNRYLEIGVESGFTFNNVHFKNKKGIDPCPTFKSEDVILKTSDNFFEDLFKSFTDHDNSSSVVENHNYDLFDLVFIDGMHQVEYVINDVNNSIKCLTKNGKIILDDIIPLHVDEQHKVPVNYKIENNIVKYTTVPWTGDVWKVVYHILRYYKDNIKFNYYYHTNYRGVAVMEILEFFQLPYSDLKEINEYDYVIDFKKYIELLKTN